MVKKATKKGAVPSAVCTKPAQFRWDEATTEAAMKLAEGFTKEEAAEAAKVSRRTVYNWLDNEDFAAEVDRLSVMVGIAGRAERLRLAKRVVRAKIKDGVPTTDKDLLEWLKYAQSETDGVKLDLIAHAAAFAQDETPVADGGQAGGRQKTG